MPQIIAAAVGSFFSAGASAALGTVFGPVLGPIVGLFATTAILAAFATAAPGKSSFGAGRLISNVINPVLPQRLIYGTRRVGGQIVYTRPSTIGKIGVILPPGESLVNEQDTGENPFFWTIVALAGHECESIEDVFFGDIKLNLDAEGFATNPQFIENQFKAVLVSPREVEGKLVPIKLMLVKKFDGSQTTADQQMVNEIENWTSQHIGKGICHVAVRLQYSQSKMSQVRNISAIVKGKKIFDPRNSLTAFSNNPALCIRDYLTDSKFGLENTSAQINDSSIITAANICEEQVEFVKEEINRQPFIGLFDRYTCDLVIDSGTNLIDNLNFLTSTLAGTTTYIQGEFNVNAGAFTTPVVTIDESWLAGPVKMATKTTRNLLFNAIKGVFVDSEQNYEATSFTPVTSAVFEAQDGGIRIFQNIELRGTINSQRAQRMARLLLRQSRQQIKIDIVTNFKALELSVYDNVNVSLAIFGFVNKVFKIIRWTFNDTGTGISMELREEDAANYDWDVGDGVFVPLPPDTTFPSPFDVSPPGAPTIIEELYVASGGSSVKTRANISWAESPSQFIVAYEVSYTLNGGAERFVGRTSDLTITAFDLEPGLYIFFVKAVNNIQSESEKSQNTISIIGVSAAPADMENFSLNMIHNNATLSWNLSADLQVRAGGKIIVKFSPLLVGASWATAFNILASLSGIAQGVTVPALTGTYLIKAEDFNGQQSENASIIISDVANIVRMNAVANSTQETAFSGAKVNMEVVSNTLRLSGVTLFDSAPGLFDDTAGLFDNAGGTNTSGEYFFDTPIDIGRVVTSRVSADIEAIIVDQTDTFDERQGLFDDQAAFFDGGDEDVISLEIFIRTTDDDPSGSPVFTDFRRFVSGDYNARGYDFKIVVTSKNSAFNIIISKLQVNVDMPDVVDSNTLITSTSGLTTVNYAINFFAVPDVGVTMLDASTGDFLVVTNQTISGFDVAVKRNPSIFLAKTVNWIAKKF